MLLAYSEVFWWCPDPVTIIPFLTVGLRAQVNLSLANLCQSFQSHLCSYRFPRCTGSHLLMTLSLPSPGELSHWLPLKSRFSGVCALSLSVEGCWSIACAWYIVECRRSMSGHLFQYVSDLFKMVKSSLCILLDLMNLMNNHFTLPNYDSTAPI